MTVLYVVSDQQGAGKTALCATLTHLLREQGKEVAVFKPFAGGSGRCDTILFSRYTPPICTLSSGCQMPSDDSFPGQDSPLVGWVNRIGIAQHSL